MLDHVSYWRFTLPNLAALKGPIKINKLIGEMRNKKLVSLFDQMDDLPTKTVLRQADLLIILGTMDNRLVELRNARVVANLPFLVNIKRSLDSVSVTAYAMQQYLRAELYVCQLERLGQINKDGFCIGLVSNLDADKKENLRSAKWARRLLKQLEKPMEI